MRGPFSNGEFPTDKDQFTHWADLIAQAQANLISKTD